MTDNIEDIKYFSIKHGDFVRPMGVRDLERSLNPSLFSKTEDDAKKARTQDWGERDDLPTGDPIGDVEEEKSALKYPTKFIRDQAIYHKSLRERGFDNKNKHFGNIKPDQCCPNPHKYKNIVSNTLKFYSCKNCGADLGDIND